MSSKTTALFFGLLGFGLFLSPLSTYASQQAMRFGNQTPNTTGVDGNSYVMYFKAQSVPSDNGTLTSVTFENVQDDLGATGNVMGVALYTDNSGQPGTLIASNVNGSPLPATYGNVTTYLTASITSGTQYWFAVAEASGGSINGRQMDYEYNNSSPANSFYCGGSANGACQGTASSFPSTAPSGGGLYAEAPTIYATYTTAATGAPTLVETEAGNSTTSITFGAPTTAGELIVLEAYTGGGGTVIGTPTDNKGDIYTEVYDVPNIESQYDYSLWYAADVPAGVTTVSSTPGTGDSGTKASLIAAHYTGMATSAWLDVSTSTLATGAQTRPWASGAVTTNYANEVIVGQDWCYINTAGACSLSATGNWTLEATSTDSAENNGMAYEDQIVSSIQNNVSSTGSAASGTLNFPGIATFRDTTGPIFITNTALTTWTVPSDWNSASNTIEVIGGGGGGDRINDGGDSGDGGGGGAYCKISNLALTPGEIIDIRVGAAGAGATGTAEAGGNGGGTWFNGLTLASSSVGANGGSGGNASSGTGGGGGASSTSIGATCFAGGSGGNGSSNQNGAGGGAGGGAAGKFGNGGNGGDDGNVVGNKASGGGGGADNGANGGRATAGTGGDGGNSGPGGSGTGGLHGAPGSAGSNGGGGGGANGGNAVVADNVGGNGGAGTEWDAIHGSGGGGGSAGEVTTATGANGGSGGLYGGGGAGAGGSASNDGNGGSGGQGVIVIAYTPSSTLAPGFAWGDKMSWTNFNTADAPMVVNSSKLTGYAWSQNFGWINLAPSGSGVTNDGLGDLQGYAWGQNVGWINFSGVTISSSTGVFSGIASGTVAGNLNFGCSVCDVTTSWRPSSSPPLAVVNTTVNGGSSIVLTPDVTTSVSVGTTITDTNGCTAITSGTTTVMLYRSGVGSSTCSSSPNNEDCYVATAFTASSTCSGNTVNATTTFGVYYFADPTDSGTYAGQDWMSTVDFTDSSNATATQDSTGQELLTLSALGVTASSTGPQTPSLVEIERCGTTSAGCTSSTVTFATSTNAGELVLVQVYSGVDGDTSPGTPTDNKGDTYHLAYQQLNFGNHWSYSLWYAYNVAAGVTTVSSTIPGDDLAADFSMIAAHYTGITTTNPLDQATSTGSCCRQGTPWASPAITTTQANELMIGGDFAAAPNTLNLTPTGNWIAEATSSDVYNDDEQIFMQQIVSTIQVNASSTGTLVGSGNNNDPGIATFEGASGGASINYGTLSPNTNTGSTNQTAFVENFGNSAIGLQLSGTALTSGANSIATSSQHYATSTFTFGGSEQILNSSPTTVSGFSLSAPTSTSLVSSTIYWGLGIPSSSVSGTYSGTVTFTGQ